MIIIGLLRLQSKLCPRCLALDLVQIALMVHCTEWVVFDHTTHPAGLPMDFGALVAPFEASDASANSIQYVGVMPLLNAPNGQSLTSPLARPDSPRTLEPLLIAPAHLPHSGSC